MKLSEHELSIRDSKRDIDAELLQGIEQMLADNAARRTIIITETDLDLARKKSEPKRVSTSDH